jgi:hypothetical protein
MKFTLGVVFALIVVGGLFLLGRFGSDAGPRISAETLITSPPARSSNDPRRLGGDPERGSGLPRDYEKLAPAGPLTNHRVDLAPDRRDEVPADRVEHQASPGDKDLHRRPDPDPWMNPTRLRANNPWMNPQVVILNRI